MYSSQQGYSLVNNTDKGDNFIPQGNLDGSKSFNASNPMSPSLDQISLQFPPQNTEQFAPSSSFNPQDFSYQSSVIPPGPNQGFYSGDLSNQNPYYGGYMYPNAWAYQQQQQLQMQQLYHYYQTLFQQQNNLGFDQSTDQLTKQMGHLSLNTQPLQEKPTQETEKQQTVTDKKETEKSGSKTQIKQQTTSTAQKEKPTTKTWVQTVSKNKESQTEKASSETAKKTGDIKNKTTEQNKAHVNRQTHHSNNVAHTKYTDKKFKKPHGDKQHYQNTRRSYNRRPYNNNRQFKSQVIKMTTEDFDFDNVNTIDRDEIELDEEITPGYDKNSFFDNLNEEEQDENETKSFKETRKLDRETFGTIRRPYKKRNPRYNHRPRYKPKY